MHKLIAGVAAIALTAAVAQADPGKDKGSGGGDRGKQSAQMSGGGSDKGARGRGAKSDRAGERDRGKTARNSDDRKEMERGGASRDLGGDSDRRDARADRKSERAVERRVEERTTFNRRDGDRDSRDSRIVRVDFDRGGGGLIEGCPPGLAKRNNGCTPPGLMRDSRDGSRFRQAFYQPDWWGQRSLDGRVYYEDGYLFRLGGDNNILGYIPLLGGALSIGNPWPSYYQPAPVPDYYTDYYNLGPSGSYRYADDVLYRVDPETSAITAIAALLTGDDITVGQPMPSGYDVYNVPYAYRDQYRDSADARYRYADGYVYQVDPKTQLVAAAIQLLT